MTQEQKELLLQDLSARLPYGVKCAIEGEKEVYTLNRIEVDYKNGHLLDFKEQKNGFNMQVYTSEVKPYLFPLSSMTDEQKKECNFVDDLDSDILDAALRTDHYRRTGVPTVTYNLVDWCNKNNFDYRGLIPMGLANDATDKNIY